MEMRIKIVTDNFIRYYIAEGKTKEDMFKDAYGHLRNYVWDFKTRIEIENYRQEYDAYVFLHRNELEKNIEEKNRIYYFNGSYWG